MSGLLDDLLYTTVFTGASKVGEGIVAQSEKSSGIEEEIEYPIKGL
jgi:hypothetical protein